MDRKSIEVNSQADLGGLTALLQHSFRRPELLTRALTHRSLANEQASNQGGGGAAAAGDNERLEFLGDAVLGLVVGEALFEVHPEWHEGELTGFAPNWSAASTWPRWLRRSPWAVICG